MWKTADYRSPEGKNTAHMASTDIPISYQKNSPRSDLSHADVQIRYSPAAHVPPAIQLKQTTPLAERLQAQRIDMHSLGADAERLVAAYDNLENSSGTRGRQQHYLYALTDLLSRKLAENAGNHNLETALRILQDELNFVNLQYSSRSPETSEAGTAATAGSGTPPSPPDGPWEHMDSSPFLRTIAAYIRYQEESGNAEAHALSATAVPEQKDFSAYRFIRELSRHHIDQLTAQENLPAPPPPTVQNRAARSSFFSRKPPAASVPEDRMVTLLNLVSHIKAKLLRDGMLSHYTHNPNLKVLHSTDYLKANQILRREKLAKDDTVAETETVSKSQEVDTDFFRNTGFVFFFLEHSGAPLRGTGFGKYRYTVKLAGSLPILKDAWAILHDMAGMSQEKRKIQKDRKTQRVITPISDINDAPALSAALPRFLPAPPARPVAAPSGGSAAVPPASSSAAPPASSSAAPPASSSAAPPASSSAAPPASSSAAPPAPGFPLFSMLSLFLPSAEQRIGLETPDGQQHDTGIHDRISGNFLQGYDIIDGIALRAAHELMTLKDYCEEEYTAVTKSDKALWEYLLGMVHDMQIMVPQDVLPAQYDFMEKRRHITRQVRADAAERRPDRRRRGARDGFRLRSANNCFFDTMLAVMPAAGFADADALREHFTAQQHTHHLAPDHPVEDAHIQQFVDIFHVAITVMVTAPGQEPVMMDFEPHDGAAAHYYIRYLAPGDADGIGHFTTL